jgi:acyl-CoA synthetase (NDP forming)
MEISQALSQEAANTQLAEIFNPRSIAVIGASGNPAKSGYQILKTLIDEGYRGQIFAVNPKEREILGVVCYASILDVPAPLDLLVISLPAPQVLAVMAQAAQRGDIKGAVVVSAGFSETAIPEWEEAERKLVQLAKSAGIRVFGPNCNGIISSETRCSTSFAPGQTFTPGKIGYISQSGATGGAIMMMAADQPKPLGYSKFAHIGNMCDVSNLDLLEFYESDPAIDVIALYMEGVSDGRKLLEIASRITRKKPIVLFKVGRTEMGSVATLSHTGTLAGSDAVYDAAFRQCGIVRVDSLEQLVDAIKTISMLPKPAGNRVSVLTETGGLGITCIDQIVHDGVLQLAHLNETTQERLSGILPSMAVIAKPDGYVDMTAAALTKEMSESMCAILEDPGVDSLILMILPPTFLPAVELAKGLVSAASRYHKPVLVCLTRGESMAEAREYLETHGVATFDTPDRAAMALAALTRASMHQSTDQGCEITTVKAGSSHPAIQQALAQDRNLLEPEALQFLKDNGIKTPPFHFAKNREEAVSAAAAIGGPVVLKVVSAQVIHKSDVGGVKVNVVGAEAVGRAYDEILVKVKQAAPEASISGVLVVPCASEGTELIIGTVRDPQFGPVVMFGLGGIFVEVFKDVSFRVAPFGREVALAMIKETKASTILGGVRGQKPGDVEGLAQLLVSISEIATRYEEISEIDLNPVRVYPEGVAILDSRIILAGAR